MVAIALAGLAIIPAQAEHDGTMVAGGSTCATVGSAGPLSLRINEPISTTEVGTATFRLFDVGRRSFSFNTDGTAFVYDVIVKGSAANHYDFDGAVEGGPVTSHDNLRIPNGNKLNHVEFCYDAAPAEPETFSVSGFKYHDLDADGVFDDGEEGLGGWGILVNDVLATTTSDGEDLGSYSLEALAGDEICEQAPDGEAGWIQSEPASNGCYTVTEDMTDADFGNYKNGSISGLKFDDLNGDGLRDVELESGLGGWTIFIDEDNDAEWDEEEAFAITSDGSDDRPVGSYTLSGLKPGSYRVCEVVKSGYTATSPAGGCHEAVVVISDQSTDEIDFANQQVLTISGTKYEDTNVNGVRDGEGATQEPGVGEWMILLFEDDGEPGQVQTVATNADGTYEFNMAPGSYIVCEELPSGWSQSAPSDNEACSNLPSDVSLAPGGHSVAVGGDGATSGFDFGNFQGGQTLDCNDPSELETSPDGQTSAIFTRVDGNDPVEDACDDNVPKSALIDATDDGVITFIPVGSSVAFFEGTLTFTKADSEEFPLILEYDPDDDGPEPFREVPDCAPSDGGPLFPDPDDEDSWCVADAVAAYLGDDLWRITWNTLGVGDPKFR
ncbi:MAG: SdrD B-like domain-containing protein [Acidimicrobiia bacterium]